MRRQATAMDAGARAALERCVGDAEAFASDVWARRPLHHRSDGGYDDLLSLSDVDHMLTSTSLRLPMFRLVRDGATLPASAYTKTGRTGSTSMTGLAHPAKILKLFSEGATIVLQGMHRFWLPIARLCRQLEIALGHPAQANAYITPPGSRGLAVHEDSHDVFVLQAFGHKHWDVYGPRPGGASGGRVDDPGEPVLSVELAPGECLYLPKGTPHAARTQETLSGHLTVGIPSVTWGQVLGEVFRDLGRDPQLDEPLPVGYHRDPEGFARAVADRIEEARQRLEKVDAADVAESRLRSFLTTRPGILRGGLEDLASLETLDDASRVRRRDASILALRPLGDRVAVYLGDRELTVPARLEPALRWIEESEAFRIRDLAPYLDAESRLVLVKRLVREGLLEVVG